MPRKLPTREDRARGARITEAREAAGINKADLCRAIERMTGETFVWNTLHTYENGRVKPSGARLVALAKALGVTPEWISHGTQRPSSEPQESLEIWKRVAPPGLTPRIEQLMIDTGIRLGPEQAHVWSHVYEAVVAAEEFARMPPPTAPTKPKRRAA